MASRLVFVALLATAALVSGCGGAAPQIPESASLAPADAVVFARMTTDDDSSQWQKAERVLERIPGVRDTLVKPVARCAFWSAVNRRVSSALADPGAAVALNDSAPSANTAAMTMQSVIFMLGSLREAFFRQAGRWGEARDRAGFR